MTPNSSITSYASPSDLFLRKDINSISQLCTDSGSNPEGATFVGGTWIVNATLLGASPKVLTALASASGELESACLRAGIYQTADLQALNGVSQQFMIDIICNIAIYKIWSRRTGPAPSESVVENYNAALKFLESLSNGEKIFSFAETEQAGLPKNYQMQAADFWNNNMVTNRWPRAFGYRQNSRRYVGWNGGWNGGC